MDAYELLRAGLSDMGLTCGEDLISSFRRLTYYMVEYNKNVNLTRIVEPRDVVTLHYLDSAAIFSKIPMNILNVLIIINRPLLWHQLPC